ncbi:hypothetical protein PDIDSM_5406 [Penicillium digitatum]|nr:hypothetical protein PDIDSM_5406 [Penicillium digitatum]
MSRPPPQQSGNSTPERPYIDLDPRTQHHGPIPMPHPNRHEPRQIIQSTSYERRILGAPPTGPRLPALVLPERSADPRHMFSSDNPYLNTQPMPQSPPLQTYQQPPGSSDARGYYNPFEERIYPTSSHARDYDSHRSWTYDTAAVLPQPCQVVVGQKRSDPLIQSHTTQFTKIQNHHPEMQTAECHTASTKFFTMIQTTITIASSATQTTIHPIPIPSPHPTTAIAARACGAGDRDRRPVDPPQSCRFSLPTLTPIPRRPGSPPRPRFTVGCLLFPVSPSLPWPNQQKNPRERKRDHDRIKTGTRILI